VVVPLVLLGLSVANREDGGIIPAPSP
jgi:hypothetical protein